MDVRTFEAFSMKDAVKSVKKALGTDAVILATREKPAPGGKGTVYEVTAAAAHAARAAGASAGSAAALSGGLAPGLGPQALEAAVESLSARLTTLADQVPSRAQVQTLAAGMQELKLLLLEALRGKDGSPLKDLPEALVPVDRQLRTMGVSDVCIAELMRHLRALPVPPPAQGPAAEAPDYYVDHAVRWLMKRIKIAPRWAVMPGAVSYQTIVGPTGVGKSALVAKLAALYAVREKQQVAVVSLDHHRLAASEQMRIFCKIIGVPFVAAGQADDVAAVPEAHRDVQLVLIDTAGFSPKDAAGIGGLGALRRLGLPLDFHLCLSMTEKGDQLDQSVRAFAPLGIQSLIFTKLDESWSFGEIYNLARKWALPLSFFGIGQHIPNDVERATRERVVERIFGL